MKIENKWFQLSFVNKKRGGAWLPLLLCVTLLAGSFGGGVWLGGRSAKREAAVTDGGNQPAYGQTAGTQSPKEQNDGGKDSGSGEDEFSDWDDTFVEGTYVTSSYLAGSVKEKYGETVSPYGYTYGTPITGLKRDEGIVLQAGFDVMVADFEYWSEIVQVFKDPQLTYNTAPSSYEYDAEMNTITLIPPNYPAGLIKVDTLDTATAAKYAHDNNFLFARDATTDWGNISTLYIAAYVDLETGEKLEIPRVQIVTLEGELPDTPQLTYSFTEDGRVRFNWTRVEGAEEYFICTSTFTERSGLNSGLSVLASTTGTEWTSEAPQYGSYTANSVFKHYSVAEDDWYNDYYAEQTIEQYGEEPLHLYKWDWRNVYCVIAVSKEGSSMMSNYVDTLDIESNIPVSIATYTWKAIGGYTNSKDYDTVEEIPAYGYVTMADGSTAVKLVDYDTEKAQVISDHYIYVDDEGNYLESDNVKELKLPYRIEGTPFEDVATVPYYDEGRLKEDMRFIEEREDMLRKRAGEVTLNRDIEFEEDETAIQQVRQLEEIPITANSALSEYLALNMLAGTKVIDVSEFREAADTALLADALLEAYYQNPLILGISGYRINRRGTAVKIVYEEKAEDQARKQQEIRQKLAEIIAEIIKPGMSEYEKELAINEYLCRTCTYDDGALENAEKNNFQSVDASFKDSFTAYGALLNGRCVCAGYAAAFKLLADAAGLDCIVVTGTLEGTLPHAWNKVRIDGDWEILDVTNNDSDFLSNALLNLPDEVGRRTLTEDSDYIMDGYLRQYASTNGQKEYYRMSQMYYSYDQVAEKLAEQLNENGTALLRTEYGLDDETFNRIGSEVYDALKDDGPIYGYYWLGVIYLTR